MGSVIVCDKIGLVSTSGLLSWDKSPSSPVDGLPEGTQQLRSFRRTYLQAGGAVRESLSLPLPFSKCLQLKITNMSTWPILFSFKIFVQIVTEIAMNPSRESTCPYFSFIFML